MPTPGPDHRRPLSTALKVQLFVAGHLAAVVLIYGAAVWIGGGVAEAPMPPEAFRSSSSPVPLAQGPTGPAPVTAEIQAAHSNANTDSESGLPPGATALAQDAPAPWDIDRHGTVRWRMP